MNIKYINLITWKLFYFILNLACSSYIINNHVTTHIYTYFLHAYLYSIYIILL